MNKAVQLFNFLNRHAMVSAQNTQRAVEIAFPARNNPVKIVYVAHPIGGDVLANLKHLRFVIRQINHRYSDVVPLCAYYADVVCLDDHDPEDRARGLRNGEAIIRSGIVDECWLTGGRLTKGMQREKQIFEEMGVPVIDHLFTPDLNNM
jgi:hypothetical protein